MENISLLFRKTCELVFDQFLSNYGFAITESNSEETSFSVIYRNGERYVRFGGTLHPHDFPFYWFLSFGEGSDRFPESDWNAVALWRFIQSASPAELEKCKSLYDIAADITETEIEEKIRTNLELSILYATSFLANDLTEFRRIRAIQNRDRQPYRISTPDGKGGRSIRYEEYSASLKKKYSK